MMATNRRHLSEATRLMLLACMIPLAMRGNGTRIAGIKAIAVPQSTIVLGRPVDVATNASSAAALGSVSHAMSGQVTEVKLTRIRVFIETAFVWLLPSAADLLVLYLHRLDQNFDTSLERTISSNNLFSLCLDRRNNSVLGCQFSIN